MCPGLGSWSPHPKANTVHLNSGTIIGVKTSHHQGTKGASRLHQGHQNPLGLRIRLRKQWLMRLCTQSRFHLNAAGPATHPSLFTTEHGRCRGSRPVGLAGMGHPSDVFVVKSSPRRCHAGVLQRRAWDEKVRLGKVSRTSRVLFATIKMGTRMVANGPVGLLMTRRRPFKVAVLPFWAGMLPAIEGWRHPRPKGAPRRGAGRSPEDLGLRTWLHSRGAKRHSRVQLSIPWDGFSGEFTKGAWPSLFIPTQVLEPPAWDLGGEIFRPQAGSPQPFSWA